MTTDIPLGYCQCGCGATTRIATQNRAARGWIKGQPLQYMAGHAHRKAIRWVQEDRGYETPCHIWQLYCMRNGYGRLGSGLAHRALWEEVYGPIPSGLWVLHKCDQPACVNVEHLFLGTPSENQYDCVGKGRRISGKGEAHSQARLTWPGVRAIRASTDRPIDLARRFGVHPNTIHNVLAGRSWKEE